MAGVVGFLFCTAGAYWYSTWESPLRAAEAAYARGDLSQALVRSHRFLGSHPGNVRAARIAALSLSRLAQPQRAEAYFAVAEPKLSLPDWRMRAEGLLDAGQVASAAKVISETLRRWPDDPLALRNLAVFRFQQGTSVEATELARRLTAMPSHASVAYALLGTFYRRMSKPDDTVECHLQALQLDPDLLTVPEPAQFLKDLAMSLIETGCPSDAEPHLRRALEMRREAETLAALGRVRREAGDAEGAEQYWRQALEEDSHFVPAMTDLGSLLLGRGRTCDALELFERAVQYDHTSTEANYGLGLAYERSGQPEQATEYLRRAENLRQQALCDAVLRQARSR